MNLSDYVDLEPDFLEAMATYYKFVGKTKKVFLYRFQEPNETTNDKTLAARLEKDLLDEEQQENGSNPETILRDHLKKIYTALEKDGCNFGSKQRRKWEIGMQWLREVKFPEWIDPSLLWQQLWKKAEDSAHITIDMVNIQGNEQLDLSWGDDEPSNLKKIRVASKIRYQIELNSQGYLILLDKFVSGAIYCISPSFVNTDFYCERGTLLIPQKTSKRPFLEVKGNLGREEVIANAQRHFVFATPEQPDLEWLPTSNDKPYQLKTQDLRELLMMVKNGFDSTLLRMQYEIIP